MAETYDVVVIGAGPAGYHAAIRAAQLGMKVACIDAARGKDGKPALGGTCLRVGCIPSKALLDSSRQWHNLHHLFGEHGITTKDAKIDVGAMVGRKDKIVKQFTGGIAALFKANKVTPYYGFGTLHPGKVVKVKQHDGSEVELQGKHVILAAGSDSIELPFAKFDGDRIVDNVGALDFTEAPITPAPMTPRRFGTSVKSSAPTLSTMRSPSNFANGSSIESEPAARITCLPASSTSLPSCCFTLTILPGCSVPNP